MLVCDIRNILCSMLNVLEGHDDMENVVLDPDASAIDGDFVYIEDEEEDGFFNPNSMRTSDDP